MAIINLIGAVNQSHKLDGTINAGGFIDVFLPSTATRANVYATSAAAAAQLPGTDIPNPVALDSAGYADAWVNGNVDVVIKDSVGATIRSKPSVNPDTAPPTAATVAFTPTGNIAATNVQAAIAELDTEKSSLGANNIWTGNNTFNNLVTYNTVPSFAQGMSILDNVLMSSNSQYFINSPKSVVAAATVDLNLSSLKSNSILISGDFSEITSFGNPTAGLWKMLYFTGATTFKNTAVASLQAGQTVTTVSGTSVVLIADGTKWILLSLQHPYFLSVGNTATSTLLGSGSFAAPNFASLLQVLIYTAGCGGGGGGGGVSTVNGGGGGGGGQAGNSFFCLLPATAGQSFSYGNMLGGVGGTGGAAGANGTAGGAPSGTSFFGNKTITASASGGGSFGASSGTGGAGGSGIGASGYGVFPANFTAAGNGSIGQNNIAPTFPLFGGQGGLGGQASSSGGAGAGGSGGSTGVGLAGAVGTVGSGGGGGGGGAGASPGFAGGAGGAGSDGQMVVTF